MTIYTKTGDKGQTSLLSGDRVPKYSPRVETYGTFDELTELLRSAGFREVAYHPFFFGAAGLYRVLK